MFKIAESAASDEDRAFDAFALRDGEQKFVFTYATDKRPAGLDSVWKPLRDFWRESQLHIYLDLDARVYPADVFH